jgi:hypothetical protein
MPAVQPFEPFVANRALSVIALSLLLDFKAALQTPPISIFQFTQAPEPYLMRH